MAFFTSITNALVSFDTLVARCPHSPSGLHLYYAFLSNACVFLWLSIVSCLSLVVFGPGLLALSISISSLSSLFSLSLVLLSQLDGPFWKNNSAMYHYSTMRTPMYLIGGLLDGYRDFALRILDGVTANQKAPPPMRAVIGPWNHAFPEESGIGPNYNGDDEMIR